MEVECPICGEFTDSPESVEAHISRSTDGDHEGEVGRAFRAELQEQVDPKGAITPVESTKPATTEGAGIPIPVSTPVLFGIVALGLVGVVVWGASRQPQGGSGPDDRPPQHTVPGGA
jgi:hypothetical protein